jgi:nucleoside-diphosphate-sugar epimerase
MPHRCSVTWSLQQDFADIVDRSRDDFEALRGARIFVTGGTGFVGTWLVSALHAADRTLDLHLRVELLTRDAGAFAARQPALAEWATMIDGDVTRVPPIGVMDAAIHAATPASAALNDEHPELMRATIVDGMRSVLERLQPSGEVPLLFTSSGAVYGPQPSTMERIPETYWPPDEAIEPRNAYALGKRDAERVALDAAGTGKPTVRIARLFAFVGPFLPLDAHFAVGNFIRDAMAGNPIEVKGDGLAVRSYMYAADMVSAMVAVLVRGQPSQTYNVGSEQAVTIAELATTVRDVVAPHIPITIGGSPLTALPTGAGQRYVPACQRARDELAVEPQTSLDEGIQRTAAWARASL